MTWFVIGAEFLVRMIVVPYLILAGGVTIAQALGYSVYQSFTLFMAVASMTAFPALAKTIVSVLAEQVIRNAQRDAYKQMLDEFTKINPNANEEGKL